MAPQQTCQERAAHQNSRTRQGRHKSEAKKRPKITLKELQSSTAEIGVSVHRTTLSRTFHRKKLFLKEKISKHVWCSPKGSWETPQTLKKILWSDETKMDLFGHQGKPDVWREHTTSHHPENNIPTVMHGGGSIMLWGCFSSAETRKLVRIEGMMDGAKYRVMLEGNLFQSSRDLRPGPSFT
jgi:hypothetical protein